MNEYNEAGLPPTIPPPDWIHNVTCYSPVLLQDLEALENARLTVGSLVKGFMIIASTLAVIILNGLFLIILNKESYASTWIKPQPRIIFTAMALNDLSNGLLVLGVGLFPALWDCWPFGEILCQVQVISILSNFAFFLRKKKVLNGEGKRSANFAWSYPTKSLFTVLYFSLESLVSYFTSNIVTTDLNGWLSEEVPSKVNPFKSKFLRTQETSFPSHSHSS